MREAHEISDFSKTFIEISDSDLLLDVKYLFHLIFLHAEFVLRLNCTCIGWNHGILAVFLYPEIMLTCFIRNSLKGLGIYGLIC